MSAPNYRRPTVLIAETSDRTERCADWLDDRYRVQTASIENGGSIDESVSVTVVDLTDARAVDHLLVLDTLEPTGRTILVGARPEHYDVQLRRTPSRIELRSTIARLVHRDLLATMIVELFDISHSKTRIDPAPRPIHSGVDIHRQIETEFEVLADLVHRSA